MKQYNMFEENGVAATEGELFESATALLLMTALEYLPPHPNPFNPHIGEFSKLPDRGECCPKPFHELFQPCGTYRH